MSVAISHLPIPFLSFSSLNSNVFETFETFSVVINSGDIANILLHEYHSFPFFFFRSEAPKMEEYRRYSLHNILQSEEDGVDMGWVMLLFRFYWLKLWEFVSINKLLNIEHDKIGVIINKVSTENIAID